MRMFSLNESTHGISLKINIYIKNRSLRVKTFTDVMIWFHILRNFALMHYLYQGLFHHVFHSLMIYSVTGLIQPFVHNLRLFLHRQCVMWNCSTKGCAIKVKRMSVSFT
jgi:hypothetical protein